MTKNKHTHTHKNMNKGDNMIPSNENTALEYKDRLMRCLNSKNERLLKSKKQMQEFKTCKALPSN